jgi:hypothetical protein
MKTINLTHNKVALVDDADYPNVVGYAWQAKKRGKYWYAVRWVKIDGKVGEIAMHRQIMKAQGGQHVDHINHNALDNRRSNLRFCSRSQNMGNMISRTGSSKYKGVSWNKHNKRWVAQIQYKKRKIYLGYYRNECVAAHAYDTAALRLFGSFASINFPSTQRVG